METITIKNSQYRLDESLTINHEYFGSVDILYSFYNITQAKYLVYRYKGFDNDYEVNWNSIREYLQNDLLTVSDYLKFSLDFIYAQILYFYENPEKIEDIEDADKQFLEFFKNKLQQEEEKKPINDLRNLK